MVRPLAWRVRVSAPIRASLAGLVVLLLFLKWRSRPRVSFSDKALGQLWIASKDEVAQQYEKQRRLILKQERFEPHVAAHEVHSPPWTPEGYPTFELLPEVYGARLGSFVTKHLNQAPMRNRLEHAIGRACLQVPPTIATFPRRFYSTGRFGDAGVPDMFRLWNALLPLPLGGSTEDLVPETEWAEPARKGAPWTIMIADDSIVDTQLSKWVGASISKGTVDWSNFWHKIAQGPYRADVFKYMTLLFEGGMYANSDTAPIAHPYLWGHGAKSRLHPDLELIRQLLKKHAASSDSTHRRLWERSVTLNDSTPSGIRQEDQWKVPDSIWEVNMWPDPAELPVSVAAASSSTEDEGNSTAWTPPYPSISPLRRRSRYFGRTVQQDEASSILSPEINLVVAIDWDASVAFDLGRWTRWTPQRLRRSLSTSSGRKLQFSTNVILAKPYHPVFVDAVSTVWGLVESGGLDTMNPIDLSGAGPFTDAVLRYLLVRYGVTPRKLREVRGPTRFGDVLILQEGALQAPRYAITKMLSYVREFFPTLPGSGMAHAIPGKSLWFWGLGYQDWKSGGRRVAYRGSSGKDSGEAASWNED